MQLPDYTPTLPEMLRVVVKRFAERELIVRGSQRVTFGQAETLSARLARALLAHGIGKGTRLGLLMPNGPDWMIAFLAGARIGAIVVPINTFYQARELAWVLHHADVHTLLCSASFLSHDYLERPERCVPGLAAQSRAELRLPAMPYLRSIFVWGKCERKWARDSDALNAFAAEHPELDAALLAAVEADVSPADPALILYSSGSTADPKGAVHTHGTLVRHSYQLAMMRDLTCEDRIWTPMPFFWVGGLQFALMATLHHGACLVCQDAFEPGQTLELLERERITLAAGWPHYGRALADHPDFRKRDLSAIRGGNIYALQDAPVDPELKGNSLGMTETCGPHTYIEGDIPDEIRGSFGPPVPGVEHKIVDPESGRVVRQGELGEVCVRGYSLMQRLYKLEREQTFDDDGYYHTGDLGLFDKHGHFYFKGRLGDMIKTGGANVTPIEVERALLGFPEIKEAHVVGVADPARGQNVAAAIVLHSGKALAAAEVRARLKQELSAYKVPRQVEFFAAGSLPLTDSGKIDKGELTRLLEARTQAAR